MAEAPIGSGEHLRPQGLSPQLSALGAKGFVAIDEKRFDQALDTFTEMIGLDNTSAEAWYGRGRAFLDKGFPDSAIRDFDRTIQFRPTFAPAYSERGRAYADMGDCQRAIDDATEAIRLTPDFGRAYDRRAIAYLKNANLDRALADLNEALKREPPLLSRVQATRAEIYADQGIRHLAARRWDKAIAGFENAIALEQTKAQEFHAATGPGLPGTGIRPGQPQ